jgi:hypothetical protein
MNNFQKLQEQQEEVYYSSEGGNKLKNEVKGTLTTFRFIGDVVDVYLPRVIDMFIAISGGNVDYSGRKGKERKSDPASGNLSHPKGKGPGEPNDTVR